MIIEQMINEHRIKHYSNNNMKIRQIETNNLYDSAVDNYPCIYTYEETEVPIEDSEISAEETINLIFGGDNNE